MNNNNNNNNTLDCSGELQLIDENTCDICYDKTKNIVSLECCNGSKHICSECISCLTTFICPYCRQSLPEHISKHITINNVQRYNNRLSSSAPEHNVTQLTSNHNSWIEFIQNEYLIDPFADYYHNRESRILRRRMRQLRKRYLETHSQQNYLIQNRETRRHRRRSLRQYANTITQNFQRNQFSENLFLNNNLDDELIFNIDE